MLEDEDDCGKVDCKLEMDCVNCVTIWLIGDSVDAIVFEMKFPFELFVFCP